MAIYYLETSALVKRYRSELGTDVATELVDRRMLDDYFITSYFSVLEVEATIARALKKHGLLTRGDTTVFWASSPRKLGTSSCRNQSATI